MRRRRLLWQLIPAHLGIAIAALAVAGWVAVQAIQHERSESVWLRLRSEARISAGALSTAPDLVAAATALWGPDAATRSTDAAALELLLCDAQGNVLYEQRGESAAAEGNPAESPEIVAALEGRPGEDERFNSALRQRMRHVAVPIQHDGQLRGAICLTAPAPSVIGSGWLGQFFLAGAALIGLACAAGWFLTQRIVRPLEEMQAGAERFARGELDYKLDLPDSDELGSLAGSLNAMAGQLEERIGTIVRQSNEQEAVLASLVEGVLAVDTEQRIISLNRAAAQLLECTPDQATGRPLQEVVRNAELRRSVGDILRGDLQLAGDVVLYGPRERILQVNGAVLRDLRGRQIGAVLVLNDVSRLRQLENMRRDFAANVSHELRTPITSIKGFVETLLDGALHNPAESERFLRIIARQADRLNAIIEDLLSLSRIEREAETEELALETAGLEDVLQAALNDCASTAQERKIPLALDCSPGLQARVNPLLLQQAVGNLLDNAIKYSEAGQPIEVRARKTNAEIEIAVIDRGCGIPADHLARIFERFYRVDKARSRKLGGTGLGLAIVKHIVNAHKGRVDVTSVPGRGSTFRILLPILLPVNLPPLAPAPSAAASV